MSLLLDALKKTGQAQRDGVSSGVTSELTLQEVAQSGKPASYSNEDLAVENSQARATGHKLFTAKAPPASSGRHLNMVALVVGGGLLLAAGGGYYVWREITPATPNYQTVATTPVRSAPIIPLTTKTPDVSVTQNNPVAINQAPAAVTSTPRAAATKRRPAAQNNIVIEREAKPDTINATLTAAYTAYRNGDFATAWQLYRSVLQQDAKNRDALLGIAAIAQQQGDDTVATQYYGQVLTLDPRDPAAHAGLSALTPGNAVGTESRLKLLLNHRPDAAELHFALGNLYAEQSRWGEAQQSYFNAINHDPDNIQYVYNLAVSLDHLSLGKLAAQYYQRALQLDQFKNTNFDHAQTQQRINELTAP